MRDVLYIDLTKKISYIRDRGDLFEKWMGGTGVAVQLLEEELKEGCDPLGPDNVIVFAVGPLNGLYPMASKVVAVFKSPLTGNYGESHCGGRTGAALKQTGFGAVVIKGKSDIPVYISINGKKCYFRDASVIWGIRSTATVGRILREAEHGAGLRSILRIGRAGEKLVRFACVVSETYRHFGRLGLGTVFGSKNLKAIVISGRNRIPVEDRRRFREVYDEIYKKAIFSEATKKYHELGTSANVKPLNFINALPTMNLKDGKFDGAEDISGEAIASSRLARRISCSLCPVACIHIAAIREPYPEEHYFYKTTFVSYDYEPIYALGSMLGIRNIDGLLSLLHEVDNLGVDSISTGVSLAWATEAFERRILRKDDTIVELKWGDYKSYIQSVRYLVERKNSFYDALANGLEYASSIYGGREFALSFGGVEMSGYHTGPGIHLTHITGARHHHCDSAGYSFDQLYLKEKGLPSPESLVDSLIKEESFRQILSSSVVCYFGREIYKLDTVARALSALGINYTPGELEELGRKIYMKKMRLKMREGFDIKKARIPERIYEVPTPHGYINSNYMERAINYFAMKIAEGH